MAETPQDPYAGVIWDPPAQGPLAPRGIQFDPGPGIVQRTFQGLGRAAALPFKAAGALDVRAGIKTQAEADQRAEEFGKFVRDTLLTAPVTGGLGALGGLATRAAGPPARLIGAASGRVLGSAGSGALTAVGEGKDIGTGSLIGAAGGVLGEVGGVVGRGLSNKVFGDPRTAREVGARVGEVFPSLRTSSAKDLFRLAATKEGKAALDEEFNVVKTTIQKGLSQNRITKIRVPEFGKGRFTLQEAIDRLTEIGKGAGRPLTGERTAGQALKVVNYRTAREGLIRRLESVAPGTGKQLDLALQDRAAKRAYMGLIRRSLNPSGVLDEKKLLTNVNKMAATLQEKFGSQFGTMQAALTGGRQIPVAISRVPKPAPNIPQAALDRMLANPTALAVGLLTASGLSQLLPGPLRRVMGPPLDELFGGLEDF